MQTEQNQISKIDTSKRILVAKIFAIFCSLFMLAKLSELTQFIRYLFNLGHISTCIDVYLYI